MTGPGETRLKLAIKTASTLADDKGWLDGEWDIGADDYGSDPDYDFPQREQEDAECQ
jgi:hypothetical protein